MKGGTKQGPRRARQLITLCIAAGVLGLGVSTGAALQRSAEDLGRRYEDALVASTTVAHLAGLVLRYHVTDLRAAALGHAPDTPRWAESLAGQRVTIQHALDLSLETKSVGAPPSGPQGRELQGLRQSLDRVFVPVVPAVPAETQVRSRPAAGPRGGETPVVGRTASKHFGKMLAEASLRLGRLSDLVVQEVHTQHREHAGSTRSLLVGLLGGSLVLASVRMVFP
ncbi:MAG: hypothetical protein ACREI3_11655 [Nitrospirales bacterium]